MTLDSPHDPAASVRVSFVGHWFDRTACRLGVILMAFACAYLPLVYGSERAGDANAAKELREYATAAHTAQKDLLALCEAASGEEQFDLYWAYNQSTGTWLQVEFLRTLLDRAAAATSTSDEQKIRTTLRDQALFTLWALDQNIAYPRRDTSGPGRPERLRLDEILLLLLRDVRSTVKRLSADG